MMICGERGIPMPDPNPVTMLADSRHAAFFACLTDDLLMDCFRAYRANADPESKIDSILIDVVRAEFARRHAPVDVRELLAAGCDTNAGSHELSARAVAA